MSEYKGRMEESQKGKKKTIISEYMSRVTTLSFLKKLVLTSIYMTL